jgi:hypothetical protein
VYFTTDDALLLSFATSDFLNDANAAITKVANLDLASGPGIIRAGKIKTMTLSPPELRILVKKGTYKFRAFFLY